jgi:hypothetical protein
MPTSPPITIPAYGTTLKKGTVALALVFEIDGPESENAGRNTTHLGSVKKSKRPTLPEGQPLSGKAYTDATNYAVLTADHDAGTIDTWSLGLPKDDGGVAVTLAPTFEAWPSKVKMSGIEEDGTITIEFELTPANGVTW